MCYKDPAGESPVAKVTSDGSTASYYELPHGSTQLQHLISHKDMNAQIGEIFRACYRYGEVSHSDKLRDAKKILFYAQAEVERLESMIAAATEPRTVTAGPMPVICTICHDRVVGRIFYLGNEPRCALHSGE